MRELRTYVADALDGFKRTKRPQAVTFTAPTASGKTIVMAALLEAIFCGDEQYGEQRDAVMIWLSDSPQLNKQSRAKIEGKSDRLGIGRCVAITEESFDQELLDDGRIYFLNTQKLGDNSNLTKRSDRRRFTIWETLANTIEEKSDRLYFIIDEAHRGATLDKTQEKKHSTKLRNLIFGFEEKKKGLRMPPLPVVIGMSATSKRFLDLVRDYRTTHPVTVTYDDVRRSGLLKERIILTYLEDNSTRDDMSVLEAACKDWLNKCALWKDYSLMGEGKVEPVLVVQVENGTDKIPTTTNLDECVKRIMECASVPFEAGSIVHTIGGDKKKFSSIPTESGYVIEEVEPSRIDGDTHIRVVFFKENLGTGWDCPRAETMVSFRTKREETSIAQLLGRMVRSPLQKRIPNRPELNTVRLFLPYFNRETSDGIVDALMTEAQIPSMDVEREGLDTASYVTYSTQNVRPLPAPLFEALARRESVELPAGEGVDSVSPSHPTRGATPRSGGADGISREEVREFINGLQLRIYRAGRAVNRDYLKSLFKLAAILSTYNLQVDAVVEERVAIVKLIREYIEVFKRAGTYDKKVSGVQISELKDTIYEYKESWQVKRVTSGAESLFVESNVKRQFRDAEQRLRTEGIGKAYVSTFMGLGELEMLWVDVVLYANDDAAMEALQQHCKSRYEALYDEYSWRISSNKGAKDAFGSTEPSYEYFELPPEIGWSVREGGTRYERHLYVDGSDAAAVVLNEWEKAVIDEERSHPDFVCWIRNVMDKPWSFCITYEENAVPKTHYPDFIVVRRHPEARYEIGILEPHRGDFVDNLGKAKAYARYVEANPQVRRMQLIREERGRIRRLDMGRIAVREKVKRAVTPEQLDAIFAEEGFVEGMA